MNRLRLVLLLPVVPTHYVKKIVEQDRVLVCLIILVIPMKDADQNVQALPIAQQILHV